MTEALGRGCPPLLPPLACPPQATAPPADSQVIQGYYLPALSAWYSETPSELARLRSELEKTQVVLREKEFLLEAKEFLLEALRANNADLRQHLSDLRAKNGPIPDFDSSNVARLE